MSGTRPVPGGSLEASRVRLKELLRGRIGSTGGWFPLTHGQEALWFLWKLAPQSWAYNIAFAVGVRGELDVAAFRRAWQTLSDRHPCLRTEFREEGCKLYQRALQDHPVRLLQIDASGWSEEQVREAVSDQAHRPFDLEADATMRVVLFRRGHDRHVLVLVVHHIVLDLWSAILLMDELQELYPAEKQGTGSPLPPLPLCYEDYVRWRRRSLEGDSGERLWAYWQQELAGELPVLDLPTDRLRPPVQSFRGATVTRRLDADLTRGLKRLAAAADATLFMTLLAAYQVLLHRYTMQDDILVGSPTADRHRDELTGLVGDFVNMVALRADFRGGPTFRQLLVQTRAKVVGAIQHQDYPFSLVVDRLQPARDLSRTPIFQTTFALQKFQRFPELARARFAGEDEPEIPFAGLVLEPIPFVDQEGQYDLNLEMKEDDRGRLVGAWKYDANLFEPDTVARLAGHFEDLLREIVAQPDRPVAALRLLTAEESRAVIAGGRGPSVELPPAASVCELFEARIGRSAGAVAVSCGDASLSYAELGRRVDDLARSLVRRGVGRDVLVAVLLPRGLDFVTAILAVSRAGGAFLPLDPRYPWSRSAQIIDSSGTPLVLTSEQLAEPVGDALSGLVCRQPPSVVTFEELAREPATEPLPKVRGEDLAYVMFTSGSTGNPKGVMVAHRGMINHVLGKISDLGLGDDDRLAQNGPQSFDIVVWQCLAALVTGGRTVVFPDDVAEDPVRLIEEVERRGVTVLQLVPSMLRAVLQEAASRDGGPPALATLRWMVPTGEALPTELCRWWLELYPDIPVLNTYGSTECSDDQCHYRVSRLGPLDEAAAVTSIGTPIHNLTAYVLDAKLDPVPVGVVGELYIGGIGVGRGYLHDPERTTAAFLPDPFSSRSGARMYRTRDMVRRRRDGNLDFLGRADQMIKLRGFRVEPQEIEMALCRHPAVSAAAVVARPHPSGERRLVAYVVTPGPAAGAEPGALPGGEDLRQFIATQLPQYMVPAGFFFVDALPLTDNGKLDPRRLPNPEWRGDSAEPYVAPRTPTEATIASIWAQVLGLDRVGVTQDFFAIGGDSIRSIQIVTRCKPAGLDFRPSDLFQHSTVAALARLADRNPRHPPRDGAVTTARPASAHVSREQFERALGQVEFDGEAEPREPGPGP